MQPCWHSDLGLPDSRTPGKIVLCCLNHPVHGTLLWKPQLTNTWRLTEKKELKLIPRFLSRVTGRKGGNFDVWNGEGRGFSMIWIMGKKPRDKGHWFWMTQTKPKGQNRRMKLTCFYVIREISKILICLILFWVYFWKIKGVEKKDLIFWYASLTTVKEKHHLSFPVTAVQRGLKK